MYTFVDIDEYQTGRVLPAEAMSYNGTYIENEITGYRTLYTSGRELLVSELQTGEINGIDGARYLGRRRPVRTIKVGYQLIADSPSEFRNKFNKLNSLLRGEQVQIIFADEPDKYFIGTKTGNTEIEPGMNAVIGEIEITCVDPYKYSTTLKGFTAGLPDSDAILSIEPSQAGSGEPSPANVRQISGHTGIDVTESGLIYRVSFPSSAGTVYGGTVDLGAGTLTVDKYCILVDPSKIPDNYIHLDVLTENVRIGNLLLSNHFGAPNAVGNTNAISNWLPNKGGGYSSDVTGFYFSSKTAFYLFCPKTLFASQDAAGFKQYLADNPLYICYDLETPQTYQLSAAENGVIKLNINNEGTEPCAVRYEITNNADNGLIGIVSNQGVLQFGSPEEVDGEQFQGNEKLSDISNWPATRKTSSVMHPSYNYQGTIKKINNVNGLNVTGLVINSFGTRVEGTWNGACQELTLPADSTGATGAKNFYCWMNHWFMTGVLGQTGEQGVAFVTSDNKFICGVQIVKADAVGNDAYIEYFVNGKIKKQIHFQPTVFDSDNPFNGRGANDVLKEGSTVRFYWWGTYFSFTDPEIEDMECAKIQLTFDNYGTRESYVSVNAIGEIKFEKMNVDGWKDIPNRYRTGDKVIIDGSESKVYVNSMYRPQDEVIGSRYFKAEPGTNEVQVVVSDWCAAAPTVKAYIREVWQ